MFLGMLELTYASSSSSVKWTYHLKTSKNSGREEQINPEGPCSVQGHAYLQPVPGVLALAPSYCTFFSDARAYSRPLSRFPTLAPVKVSFYECVRGSLSATEQSPSMLIHTKDFTGVPKACSGEWGVRAGKSQTPVTLLAPNTAEVTHRFPAVKGICRFLCSLQRTNKRLPVVTKTPQIQRGTQ